MNPYQIGKVYIWQNLGPRFAHLNGTETTVKGGCVLRGGNRTWETDTPHPKAGGSMPFLVAYAGELRPKDMPSGEGKVLALFVRWPVCSV